MECGGVDIHTSLEVWYISVSQFMVGWMILFVHYSRQRSYKAVLKLSTLFWIPPPAMILWVAVKTMGKYRA